MRRYFTEKDIQMADKHMKWCATTPISRKRQIKSTKKHHYTLIRMVKFKKKIVAITNSRRNV
jgi:hypothetical protein